MERRKKRISMLRDIKHNLILDAALTVFSDKGFHPTRLEDIAKEAGFSKAALYNYYSDKENIFFALALREHVKVRERFVSDPSSSISNENSFSTNLKHYIETILDTFHSNFSFLVTLDELQFSSVFNVQEPGSKLDSIKCELFNERKKIRKYITDSVEWARKAKVIDTPLSTDRIASCIEGLIFSIFREWRRTQQIGDIEKTVEELVLFGLKGCNLIHTEDGE
ncbi:TetR/AcrR family transcriptional regulator [Chitinispirillales bacterium ANBcel5]|uniref:TetR/AcrR family transcriptional regulator n=1 Tax=Cellulosispirillum alkaliphilum TaxID=3039283 RepID=UPI002A551AC4|nr:TetR/AcrR family transcriptional regulator [Chitinispirillales bacterium ANBcel5]